MRQVKHIAKWKLWLMIIIYVITIGLVGDLLINPPAPKLNIDCKKAMSLWNYDVGQLTLANLVGDTKKSKQLKSDYERLVLSRYGACFPSQLVDFIFANKA